MRKGKIKQICLHAMLLAVGLVIIPLVGYAVSISGAPTTARRVEARAKSGDDNVFRERKAGREQPTKSREAHLSRSSLFLGTSDTIELTQEEINALRHFQPLPTFRITRGHRLHVTDPKTQQSPELLAPPQLGVMVPMLAVSYQNYYDHYPHRSGRFCEKECDGPSYRRSPYFRADPAVHQNYYMYNNFNYGWP